MVRYKNEPIVKSSEPMNQQQLVCVGNDGYEGKVWQKFVLIKLCSSLKIIGVSAVLLVAVSALTFILFEGLNSSIHYTIIVRSDENKTLLNFTHKESRFKRSIIPRLKRVTRNTLKQLEPNGCCNEHCSFIKTQVANLQGETIKIYSELQKLNQYLENLKINCLNKTNNQLNVDMVNFKKDTTGGLFDNSVSENEDNYEAAASDNDYSAHIPPTGPDGGYLTGAGESLKTSQQMVVNMPQRLEKICYPVGGTTKNIVCSDMPVQQNPYFLTRQSQPGNYFVRLLGKNSPNNVDEGSMHVPTAISSPNPYFLPTLEGYPIVSPVSSPYSLSGASPQMYAAFNPYSGYTSIQSPNQPIIVSPMGYQSTGYQPAPNLQPMFSVPRQPQMFCTYIAVPGSQYRFPPVSGVSESGQKNELDLRAKEASRQSIEENFKFNKTTVGSKSAEDFYVLCKDGQLQISRSQLCDNRVDCIDKSDEMFCSCKSRMGSLKACDRYPDCPNGEDEEECFGCSKDMLNCDDDIETGEQPTCIPYTKRCDNVMDCRNGKDEIDCSLIAKDIGSVNDKFPISYSEGYVHRNYNGKWYPVCHSSASEHWAKSACIAEFGPSNHDLQTQIANSFDYQGLFVISDPYGGISLSSRCGTGDNHITWVKCPQIDCGTRSPQAIPYEDNFNRYKRYLSEHGFYEVSNDKSSYKKFCSYEQAKEAAPANEPPAVFPFPQTNPNEQDTYERYWGPLLNPYLGYDISNTGNTGNTGRASPSYSNLRYVRETPQNRNPRGSERRIVGGSKSMPGAWPWVVLIHKDGHIHCGGVILNEYFVLTAAHCMDNYVQHFFEVRAGILRRLSFSPQEQRRVIGSVEIHSNYNTKDFSNDIAVVKVNKPFNFNRWVLPILPPPDIDNAVLENTCTVVGWGATEEHGKDPDQMHEVELPILSGCKHRADRQADDICAGYEEGGKDSCQGDSGGPLLCTMDGYDKWYVAGIVSHGNGCARKEEPGVYTRVRLYTDWIKRATRNLLNSQRPRPKSKCPGYTCDDGLCIRKLLKCNDIVDCLQPDDELCDDENSGEYVTQLKTNNETEQMEVESHSQSNVQVINIPSVVESISTPKTVKPGGDRNLDELTFVTEIKTSTAVNTEFGVNLKPTVGIDSLVKQKNSDENDISAKPPIVTTQEMVESTSPKFGIHEESSPLPKETSDCTDGSCLTKGNESEEQNLGPSTVPPFTTQSPTSQHFTNKDENSSEWKEATATETDLKSHMEKSMERTTMPTPTEIKITLPVRSGETLVANSTKVSEQDENISPSSLADKNMSSDSSAEIETSDNSTSTFIGQNTGGLSSGDLTKGNNSREEISDNEDSSTEKVAALNKTQDNSSEENSSGEEHTTNGTFNNSLELNRLKEANKSTTYDSTETFDDSFKTNVSSKQESGDKQFSADVLKYNSSIHQGSENQSSNGLNNQNIGSTSLENGTSSNLTASNISRETTFEESNRTRVDGDVKNKDFASKVNVSDNSDLKTTEQPPIKNNSDEFDSSKDQIVYNINGAAVENITINPLVEATTKSSAKVQVGSNENLIGNVTDDSDLNVTEPTITKNNSDQYVSNKDQISYDISGQTVENITIIPLIEATTKSTVKEQVGSNENSKENVSENSDLKVTERTITKNNSDQFVSNKDQISYDISGQTVENITIIPLIEATTKSTVKEQVGSNENSKENVSENSDLKVTERTITKNNSDQFVSNKDQISYDISGQTVENITIIPLIEATTKSTVKEQVGSNENSKENFSENSDLKVTERTITKNNSDQYVSNKDQISYDISGQTVENITIIPLIEATTKSTVKEQVGSNEKSKENVSENSDLKVTERTITKNNSDQFVSNKDQISHDISGQTVENITIISLVDSTTVSSVINSSEVDKIKNKEEFSSQQMNQSISMESNKSSHEHTSHSSNFTHMNSSSSSVGSESLSAQTVNFTQNSNITHQLETQSATQQNSSLESKIESQVSTSSNNSLAASEDQRLSNKTDSESSNFNAPTQNSTVSEFNSDTNIKRNTSSCIASISKTLVTTDTGEIKEEIVRKNCSNSETKNQLRFEEDNKFFQCRSLNQSVYRYKMCDGITDCFDLSDESNCTCRLKLERKLPHLICDTRKDCLDGTDEATCEAKCPEGQFSCSKSKSCISAEQRCDGTAQCKHNEDEENCYAIVDGDSVTLDHAGRPKLSNTGLVYYWKNNDWSPYCVTEEEMDLTKALKACNSYHYEDVGYVLKNITLPPSEKNLGTNDGLHCLVPNVICSSMYPDRQQPWKAYLYLNDNLYGIAVLIDSSWMITGALTDLDIQNNVMYAQMGSIDNSLDIIGPYTQYIQIDDVIHNENFTLLHLSHKPEFTHGVVPIGTLERPTSRDIVLSPKEPDCLAVGLSTEYLGEVVMDLQLLDDCWEGENCFKILKPLQNCEQTKSPVFGYISCYSYNYGTSLVSLFHQEDGFCRDSCKVNYQSISDYSTTIKEAIASYQGSQFNEPVCETIKCELGNCLAWDQLSNGVFDCDDGRDESEEAKGRKTTYCETHQNCSCKPAEFKCTSGECLHLSKYCNGSPDCIDGSDESEKCMSCDHFLSMTTPDRLCDSNINCENKEDENVGLCQSKYNCSSDMFFNCERSKVCIPNDFVCDFEKDCPQGEDEEECKGIDMELENEGIFSENLSGFWYSKCVTMKPTERSLNDLCQYVNNSTHKQYMMRHVNKEIIVKDVFSSLRINENVGFHIRMDRPYLRKDINGTCIVLYVVCN